MCKCLVEIPYEIDRDHITWLAHILRVQVQSLPRQSSFPRTFIFRLKRILSAFSLWTLVYCLVEDVLSFICIREVMRWGNPHYLNSDSGMKVTQGSLQPGNSIQNYFIRKWLHSPKVRSGRRRKVFKPGYRESATIFLLLWDFRTLWKSGVVLSLCCPSVTELT